MNKLSLGILTIVSAAGARGQEPLPRPIPIRQLTPLLATSRDTIKSLAGLRSGLGFLNN
jgi:hypothetical protein